MNLGFVSDPRARRKARNGRDKLTGKADQEHQARINVTVLTVSTERHVFNYDLKMALMKAMMNNDKERLERSAQ